MTNTLSPGEDHTAGGKIPKHQVGIYGWRKRCLYGFILFIFAVLILNIALTVWIIRVMDFSLSGVGHLQLIGQSVRVNGQAEFLESLYASSIKTRKEENLFLESSNDVVIHARDNLNRVTNEIKLGNGRVEVACESFLVKDKKGNIRFGVDKDGTTFGSNKLKVSGLRIDGMLQTPLIRGPDSDSLRLQSLTRGIKILAPEGVQIGAPVGKIHLSSLDDIIISSKGKGIRLDSQKTYLKNLPLSSTAQSSNELFQLCVCKENGRLFLDNPGGNCSSNQDICNS